MQLLILNPNTLFLLLMMSRAHGCTVHLTTHAHCTHGAWLLTTCPDINEYTKVIIHLIITITMMIINNNSNDNNNKKNNSNKNNNSYLWKMESNKKSYGQLYKKWNMILVVIVAFGLVRKGECQCLPLYTQWQLTWLAIKYYIAWESHIRGSRESNPTNT